MGIDLYAEWDGMTHEEKEARYTGFQDRGASGYIREAYHGEPYATEVMIPEAWSENVFQPGYVDPDGKGTDSLSGVLIARSPSDPPEQWPGQPRVLLQEFLSRKPAAINAAINRGLVVYDDEEYGKAHAKEVNDFIDLVDAKVSEGATLRIYSSY